MSPRVPASYVANFGVVVTVRLVAKEPLRADRELYWLDMSDTVDQRRGDWWRHTADLPTTYVGAHVTRTVRKILLVLACIPALSACQITPLQYAGTPGPAPRCSAIRTRIAIDAVGPARAVVAPGTIGAAQDSTTLENRILDSYERHAAEMSVRPKTFGIVAQAPVSASMLFLSGGSQNGAFGAGFLDGWAKARTAAGAPSALPRFTVVTGISTGALQSTFAFLGRTDVIAGQYRIEREDQLLHAFVKGGLKSKSVITKARAGLALAQKGAVSELAPLREKLRALITEEVLRAVAKEASSGRHLLVGAVELDSGDAYIFDLTSAATAYVADLDAANIDHDFSRVGQMRDCYIEALMASSSVPMAALPVFIDGKLYIDGGARFGVVSDFSADLMEKAAHIMTAAERASNRAPEPKNLFILVNGTLEAGRTCDLGDCPLGGLPPPIAGVVPQHGKWSFDKLALRSMSVLINQSYRSSVYWATREATGRGFTPHFIRIEPDLNAHRYNGQNCAGWTKIDNDREAPLEFHARFMRCEIDYGQQRREVNDWAALE